MPHTWNQSGLQENVLGNQFSSFVSPRDYSRIQSFNLTTCKETEKQSPEAEKTKTINTSEDKKIKGTIPMTRPLTTCSTIPVELQQNYMVGQQRQQISELQFDRFLIHNRSSCRKFDSKHKSRVLIFRRMPWLWITEVETVGSLDE